MSIWADSTLGASSTVPPVPDYDLPILPYLEIKAPSLIETLFNQTYKISGRGGSGIFDSSGVEFESTISPTWEELGYWLIDFTRPAIQPNFNAIPVGKKQVTKKTGDDKKNR